MDMRRQNIYPQHCHNCRGSNHRAPQHQQTVRSAASAPKPAATPVSQMAQPAPEPAPAVPAAPVQQAPPVKASAPGRCYLAAYAKDFKLAPAPQGAAIPLESTRAEGGLTLRRGAVGIPADGYYMLLWEVGIARALGAPGLRLGINQAGTLLNGALEPGYDSGQQVTWLSEGDQLSLQILGSPEEKDNVKPEVHGSSAQLTVLRMG